MVEIAWIDISEKPKSMTKREHEKLKNIQEYLKHQSNQVDYLKEFNPIQFEKLKEVSAQYQLIVFDHYEM